MYRQDKNSSIRFRAYDLVEKKMYHWDDDRDYILDAIPFSAAGDEWSERCVVMRCTGFPDSSGKAIYEGDVFTYRIGDERRYWYVEYCDDHACFNIYTLPQESIKRSDGSYAGTFYSLVGFSDLPDCDFKILGNVFENKEFEPLDAWWNLEENNADA